MKKVWIGLIAVVLVVGLSWYFLTNKKDGETQETIKIGAILPLTGDLAFLGKPGQNALILAQEKINSDGGLLNKPLNIEYYDSQGESKNAVTVANKAISVDKQKILLTTLTNASLAIKDIASNNGVLQLIIAIAPNIANNGKYALQMCYSAKQEANEINQLIKNTKSVGVISSKDAASNEELEQYIIPFLKENNIDYYVEKFDVGQQDYKALATKVSQWKTSDVIILGYGSDFPNILKEITSFSNKKINIWGGIGFAEIPDNTPQSLLNNVTFVAPRVIQKQEGFDFFKNYKERFKTNYVPYDAAYTYDALMLLAEIINEKQSIDPSIIYKTMTDNIKYTGVTGEIKIEQKEISTNVVICKFENGVAIIK